MKKIIKIVLLSTLLLPFSCGINKVTDSPSNQDNYSYFEKVKVNNIKISSLEEPDANINNFGNGFIFWKNKGRKISNLSFSGTEILLPEDTEKSFIFINDSGNGLLLINSKIYNTENTPYRNISYQRIQSYNLVLDPEFIFKKEINNDSVYSVLDVNKQGNGSILLSSENDSFNYFEVKDFNIIQNILKKVRDENYPPFLLSKDLRTDSGKPRQIIKLDQNKNGFITNTISDPNEIVEITKSKLAMGGFILSPGSRLDYYPTTLNYITPISENILKDKKDFIIYLNLSDSSDFDIDKNGTGIALFIYSEEGEAATLFGTGLKNYHRNDGSVYNIQSLQNNSKILKPRVYLNENLEGIAVWYEVAYGDKTDIEIYAMPIRKNNVLFVDRFRTSPSKPGEITAF